MYCRKCGNQMQDGQKFCPNCGAPAEDLFGYNNQTPQNQAGSADDNASIGWGILGFFFPLVGLILYLVWKDSKPRTAKMAGKGALIGVIVNAALSILSGIISFFLGLSIFGGIFSGIDAIGFLTLL